jgi:hypothetical protein
MFAESETRTLGRLFGSVIAGTRGWRTVHNEELRGLLPFIPHLFFKVIEFGMMKSAEKLARTEYMVNACGLSFGKH